MTNMLQQCWKPSAQAAASRVGDETVLLHLVSGTYFGLDPVGTRIWQALTEGRLACDAAASIAEEYGQPLAQVEEDAAAFLSELAEQGLLERG